MTSRTFGTKTYPRGFPAFIKESFAGVDLTNHASLASLESAMLRIGEFMDEAMTDIFDQQVKFARSVAKHIKNAKESDSHRGAFKRTTEYKIGDVVTVYETRPLSKTKTWALLRIEERATAV